MGMVCLLACCCGCSGRPEGCGAAAYRTHRYRGCLRYAADGAVSRLRQGGAGGQCGVQGRRDAPNDFRRRGEFVRRGAPLAALDARDYRLQAEAAEAEYKRVKAEAERVMALYADGAATPDAYDKARYGLQQITAKYENSRNQLADTEIRMPFDGYVQKRLFDPSTVVGAGMPVLTVVSAEAPEIEINIPRLGVCPPQRIRRLRGGLRLLARQADSAAAAEHQPEGQRQPALYAAAGRSGRFAAAPVAGYEYDGDHRMPAFGGCAGGRAGRRALRRRRPDVRLDLPGGQYGREPRGTGRAVADRRRSGRRAGLAAGERIVTSGVHRLREGEKVAPLPGVTKTNVGGLL